MTFSSVLDMQIYFKSSDEELENDGTVTLVVTIEEELLKRVEASVLNISPS